MKQLTNDQIEWLKIQSEWLEEHDWPMPWDYIMSLENWEAHIESKYWKFPLIDIIKNKPDGITTERRKDQRDYRDGCCSCTLFGALIRLVNYLWLNYTDEWINEYISYGIEKWWKPEWKWRATWRWQDVMRNYHNERSNDKIMFSYTDTFLGENLHPVVKYCLEKDMLVSLSYNVHLDMYREAYATNKITKSKYNDHIWWHSSNLKYKDWKYYLWWSSLSEDAEFIWWEKQLVELWKNWIIRNGSYVLFTVKDDNPMDEAKNVFKEAREFVKENNISNWEEPERNITRWEAFVIIKNAIDYVLDKLQKENDTK